MTVAELILDDTNENEVKKFDRKPIKRKTLEGKKINNGRICRTCGCNPYPNYFYCVNCHRGTYSDLDDEHSILYK